MKLTFKRSLCLLVITALFLSLIGCASTSTSKPDSAVSGFFDALKKEDVNSAAKFVKTDSKNEISYKNADEEKIAKAVFSKLDYKIESSVVKGDTATVNAKVTTVDLVKITGNMISDLLPTLMAKALSGEDQNEAETEKLINQYFTNSINDPSAMKTTTDVTINLVKSEDKKSWLIDPNDDLLNAMTGNLQNAFKTMNSN
ncbi:NTF2-like N-terminal transpeptidase domain-containing protein [Clostridium omnivorum]|uniref:Lipoprotein n=1 Tax=Clostridium omnivorum TaxID=1604902 RepID=A0ABQ5NAZ9_9CLOT|nr:NTF2-like N-terminal transpeptidase domain-containing protein [Clostridium sp. E14]GLC32444.1 lipoprotein [Clostridium sp. E14]